MDIDTFQNTVYEYYDRHGRHELPWRIDASPYAIFVSELMLQQTQVERVIPKFNNWMDVFTDFESLASAAQAEVLTQWQGLGYNRRARFAYQSAQLVVDDYGGQLPESSNELQKLPGVGENTAGAILAYAFNQPVTYIETNIRTVFIYHFFAEEQNVSDTQLLPFIEKSLDRTQPRQWYWALMDYGSHLKRTHGNMNHRSKKYQKQSPFEGSFRQLRSRLLREILDQESASKEDLMTKFSDPRAEEALQQLVKEGLISYSKGRYQV